MSRRVPHQTLIASLLVMAFLAGAINLMIAAAANACPFCAGASMTFSEEINSMDAVVIAELIEPPASSTSNNSDEVPKAKFKITQVIKGQTHLEKTQTIETIFFGEATVGKSFLVMGVDPPNLMWSTPLPLSDRGKEYVTKLLAVPAKGPERLVFFQEFLEDEDEMLARDAYDEFAKAPYAEVKMLKAQMDYENLSKWIQSTDVPASRRRLYLTLLGVCGSEKDLPILEEMMKSTDRKQKAGLDALIGCYLTLRGADGMPLVEDLFLKNKAAEYADTYAAIMALRFHGTEGGVMPRERVVEGLRHMLGRPQLADLVIPDLARWEDWSVMETLVQLFKEADDKSSWVRVPVINYLRACPKPEAKTYIEELEKIDPAAVKRALNFFPVAPAGDEAKTSNAQRVANEVQVVATVPQLTADEQSPLIPPPVLADDEDSAGESVADLAAVAKTAQGSAAATPAPTAQSVAAETDASSAADAASEADAAGELPAAASSVVADQSMNPFTMLGVMAIAGVALMVLLWSILRGAGGRAAT